MKSKTKFDPKVIQQFFIDHTEKFVIGLVAALFLYFTYQSFTLKRYEKEAKDLQQKTNSAAGRIDAGCPANVDRETRYSPYADLIDEFKKPINPLDYPIRIPPFGKILSQPRLRQVPEVFAVEQLQATAGRGALAKEEKGGNRETRGKRWVIVTGLVPYKKQLAEYHAKFDTAAGSDPAKDLPSYAGYFIQRAEVVPGETEPQWSRPTIFAYKFAADTITKIGGHLAEEIADPRLVRPSLTSPLFLVADAPWGVEAVSPPQIPIAEREAGAADDSAGPPVGPKSHQPGPGPNGKPPRRGSGPRAADGTAPPAPEPSLGGTADLLSAPDNAKPEVENAKPQDQEVQVPEYLLLRYFDFDVKPGKQYQYRVFLVLHNPNYHLDAALLDDPENANKPFIGVGSDGPDPKLAKWSDPPCTSNRLPGDMRLLVGKVVAKAPQEVNGEVRILNWTEKNGRDGSFNKENLVRGTVLNFPDAVVKSPGGDKLSQPLDTRCLLVDVQGGEAPVPRDRSCVTPGLILVMDDAGNLILHDEVAETKQWEEATKEPEREQPKATDNGRGHPRPPRDKDKDKDKDKDPDLKGLQGEHVRH
jgi:hypothetical protein